MRIVMAKRELMFNYYDDDPARGIIYDWKKVFAEYRKLGCPPEYFDPTLRPVDVCKYLTVFSRRATGKTTGILLLGLLLHEMYGVMPVYVRQVESMIAPMNTKTMMDVIVENGYISNLTENRWNGAFLYRRYWYYCNYDEAGKMVEKCSVPCCFMCDIQDQNALKSGFNNPLADYIVYDEFVNPAYIPDEFVSFMNLISTIGRQRFSPVIWMLSNNTNKEAQFFYELECDEIVRYLDKNKGQRYKTEKGTECYVEWFAPEIEDKKSKSVLEKINKLFFGFKNPKIGSITGEGWGIDPAQRIKKGMEEVCDFVWRNVYIYFHERYAKIDMVVHPQLGVCLLARWASPPANDIGEYEHDDTIVLTCEFRYDPHYRYGLGTRRMSSLITKCMQENRVYYASNDVRAFLMTYIEHYSNHRYGR